MNKTLHKQLLTIAMLLLSAISLHAQSRKINGTITDQSTGKPLSAATVTIKGTTQVIPVSANGTFSLDVINPETVLVVTYIGYGTQEITVGKQTNLNIAMSNSASNLNDVVVVGFGTVKRRDLTGAIVSVKPEEITARPGPNPIESLQGRVAGLDITRTSGQPGAGVNLQLRGTRSFTNSTGTAGNTITPPLFIINGLPGDYSTINPYDIESIEVLKDASSTSVYGSSGANGVILITTKSGKAGKINVDFNSYVGYNGLSITPTMRTGDSYLQTKRDAYRYVWDATAQKWTTTGAQWQSPADDPTIFGTSRWATYQQGQFVNWADAFLRKDALTQNYSIGISGGSERTKAYISFNYTDENGQYRGDRYKLYTTNIRLDHRVRDWISIGGNIQASYVDRDKAQDKLENALTTDPLVRLYDSTGKLNTNLGNNVYNLLLDYQPGVYSNVDENTRVVLNPYIEIRPIKGLSLLSRASAEFLYNNTYRFDGIGSVSYTYTNANISRAQITQNQDKNYYWENILTYNRKIKEHDLTLTGVSTYYSYQTTSTQMLQSNILSNNFKWYNFKNDVNTIATTGYRMRKTYGLIGRINYSYKGKYLLSASARRDASTVLYPTNRWDNFYAASAGWRISDENFMAGTKGWLNNLKLRVGWGVVGNSNILPYTSQTIVQNANASLGGVLTPIYRNSQYITNPELGWEKSYNTNIGLDISLFKSRIDITLENYYTHTPNVIYPVVSPAINGTYTPGVLYQTNLNIAETRNRGFEATVNSRNIVTRDFEWSTQAAFALNHDEVVKLTGGTANNIANGPYTLAIGAWVNSYRNYKLDGVWQIGEEADAAAFNKIPGDLKVNVPGMTKVGTGVYVKTAANGTQTYYYANLSEAQKYNSSLTAANNKYAYSANDYQILGHNSPNWSLGFQNRFRYKSFDLTIYSYVRWGQMINYNMLGWYQPNAFATNASPSRTFPEYFNYWTPTNPSNDFPNLNYLSSTSTISGFSGLTYVDGSFFKIKNISLGYTLPSNLMKKLSIQRFRVYGTITNPLIIAKSHLIKQYDPEMNGSLDYPLTKQIVAGMNLTF